MNNHAEKGIKNSEIFSTYLCKIKAITTPKNAVNAERKFSFKAFTLEYHP